ncbi:hypothetical protein PO883_07000 [Massilia sp. DJPM01]|uniref:hypothetical protein n=1 Tax=Massilia sp. DJPM01 TaxID=3024404 RepID=UPI00259FA0CD|nr:hypothetical protein [Massilia sp. DJPM01]MDM5176944.1 hypothetical protein [Massilia sp. DJPM01]
MSTALFRHAASHVYFYEGFQLKINANRAGFPVIATLLGLACVMGTGSAVADSSSAKANLQANLRRAGVTLPDLDAPGVVTVPAMVKGMYGIYTADGRIVSLTNEAGTITGKGTGLSTVGLQPGKPRPMTPEQLAELRNEIMANLAYDKLIKVSYGNGGGRKILMFTAVDCPACNQLEKDLRKAAPLMNTTFYLATGSLRDSSAGGLPFLDKVARIRCDDNPGQAWQTYWANRSVPPARACAITAASAEYDFYLLFRIMQAVKAIKPAIPMLVSEDGTGLPLFAGLTPAKAAAAFGPERKTSALQPTTQWLAAAQASKPAQPAPGGKAR